MNIKDMPHVTVEQVLALRKEAMKLEEENQALRKGLEAVKAENLSLKDWVWHKKYSEASSQGASHEVARDFSNDGVSKIIDQ